MALMAEITVEPFVEGDPGPHVVAAWAAAAEAGVEVEHGPFASSVTGEDAVVLAAVDGMVRAAVAAGASGVAVRIRVDAG